MTEWHVETTNQAGTVTRRPLSIVTESVAGTGHLMADADTITLGRATAGAAYMQITSAQSRATSPNGFDFVNASNTNTTLQAGTTASAAADVVLEPGGDAYLRGARVFVGLTGGTTRLELRPTLTELFSPDRLTELAPVNGQIQHIVNGALTMRELQTYVQAAVPIRYDAIAEPPAPATGWVEYTDIADGALKAKNSAGTVRVLALP
jgi:hypothetical protein